MRLLTTLLTCLVALGAWGTVHRVSNLPGTTATFNDVQTAHDAAESGDTLLIEGYYDPGFTTLDSLYGFAPAVISTPVVILGNGYFNSSLGSALSNSDARIRRLTLTSTATGSHLGNLDIYRLQVGASDVGVNHSRARHLRLQNVGNCNVFGCFLEQEFENLPALQLMGANNCMVQNTIIQGVYSGTGFMDQRAVEEFNASGTNLFDHMVFAQGSVLLQQAMVFNSIFTAALLESTANVQVQTSIFSQAGIALSVAPDGSGNDVNDIQNPDADNFFDVDMSAFFVGMSATPDQAYIPKDSSSAIGTASDGDNRGAYTVEIPSYVPGGSSTLPEIVGLEVTPDDRGSCAVPLVVEAISPDDVPIVAVTYAVNDDPTATPGFVLEIPQPNAVISFPFSISLVGLPPGPHVLAVRVLDANGNWSIPVETEVTKLPQLPAIDIDRFVYFWDDDPGYGQELITVFATGADDDDDLTNVTVQQVIVPETDFQPGLHRLFVRTYDVAGNPSVTYGTEVLLLDAPAPEVPLAGVHAFFDNDPGYGQETFIIDGGSTLTFDEVFDAFIPFTGLNPGQHTLFVRTRDLEGNFSVTYGTGVYLVDTPIELSISGLEYYWDEDDPGYGNATPLDVPGGTLTDWTAYFNMMPPAEDLELGAHTITVRVQDVEGNWSVSVQRDVEVLEELVVIDVSGDGMIGTADILNVIADFGCNIFEPECYESDFNFNTTVGTDDLLMILANFGQNVM